MSKWEHYKPIAYTMSFYVKHFKHIAYKMSFNDRHLNFLKLVVYFKLNSLNSHIFKYLVFIIFTYLAVNQTKFPSIRHPGFENTIFSRSRVREFDPGPVPYFRGD